MDVWSVGALLMILGCRVTVGFGVFGFSVSDFGLAKPCFDGLGGCVGRVCYSAGFRWGFVFRLFLNDAVLISLDAARCF